MGKAELQDGAGLKTGIVFAASFALARYCSPRLPHPGPMPLVPVDCQWPSAVFGSTSKYTHRFQARKCRRRVLRPPLPCRFPAAHAFHVRAPWPLLVARRHSVACASAPTASQALRLLHALRPAVLVQDRAPRADDQRYRRIRWIVGIAQCFHTSLRLPASFLMVLLYVVPGDIKEDADGNGGRWCGQVSEDGSW